MINLLVLKDHSAGKKGLAIALGAVIPDLIILLLYFWHLLIGTPEDIIWSVEYYRPGWQAIIDGFNSIPLLLIAGLVCWKYHHPILLMLFASMLLHCLGDLPVHHEDAHRHFFPFLEWRFLSPVSYWNPAHYGNLFSLFEASAVVASTVYLYTKYRHLKNWVIATLVVYILYWIYVAIYWL